MAALLDQGWNSIFPQKKSFGGCMHLWVRAAQPCWNQMAAIPGCAVWAGARMLLCFHCDFLLLLKHCPSFWTMEISSKNTPDGGTKTHHWLCCSLGHSEHHVLLFTFFESIVRCWCGFLTFQKPPSLPAPRQEGEKCPCFRSQTLSEEQSKPN